MKKIKFVMDFETMHFRFNPKQPDGLKLTLSGTTLISFSMKSKQPDVPTYEHWDPYILKLSCVENVSDEAFEFMERLNSREFLQYGTEQIELPRIVREEIKIDQNGKLVDGYFPHLEICPSEIQTLILSVENQLRNTANRVLGLISWQHDLKSDWELTDKGGLYWGAKDATQFHSAPRLLGVPIRVGMLGAIKWSSSAETQFIESWAISGLKEPLGHVLLREAKALVQSSPRSAIVMLAAAIEVGVKTHCSQIAPSTSWLLENLPAPPIFKIIKEFLPELVYEHQQSKTFWQEMARIAKITQKIFEIRNKVVHTGTEVNTIKFEEFFIAASDLLYLLDFLSGHEWAKENVSKVTAEKLGWKTVQAVERFMIINFE